MIRRLVAACVWILCGARARWVGCPVLDRPCVYFANHTSHLDAVLIWAAMPKVHRSKCRLIAADDYWGATRTRRWFAQNVFGALLIERNEVKRSNNPVPKVLECLDRGESVLVFPEGTRRAQREPGPFRSGLWHIARQRPDLPCVPVYVENLSRVLPKGELLPVPMLCAVVFGDAISAEEGDSRGPFLERARAAVAALACPDEGEPKTEPEPDSDDLGDNEEPEPAADADPNTDTNTDTAPEPDTKGGDA